MFSSNVSRNRNRRKSRKHLVHESAISKSIDERNMYRTKKRGQLDKWTRITNLLKTCFFLKNDKSNWNKKGNIRTNKDGAWMYTVSKKGALHTMGKSIGLDGCKETLFL